MRFKHFISITKPGIVTGNVITAIAGFFFGVASKVDIVTLLAMIVGISCVMASGCVVNNYIDRDIDRLMSRTQNRMAIYREISSSVLWVYAILLLLAGSAILYFFTNLLTLLLALSGFFTYLFFYTLWLKRRSHWGTLMGSFSGATPPVIGYCAVSGTFDFKAMALFLLLTSWQMPHFLAISLYRMKDYKKAAIPVLPVIKGIKVTQYHTLYWLVFFIVSLVLLVLVGGVHWLCTGVMAGFSLYWLIYGMIKLGKKMPAERWGQKMFVISLVNIFAVSFSLCLTPWL